jgi:hypothetical protein
MPAALLYAWLTIAGDFPDKATHCKSENWPSFHLREVARDILHDLPEARPWLEAEHGGIDAVEPEIYKAG